MILMSWHALARFQAPLGNHRQFCTLSTHIIPILQDFSGYTGRSLKYLELVYLLAQVSWFNPPNVEKN